MNQPDTMKKILYELAAVLLIAAAATGCGNRKAAKQDATEPAAQSVADAAAALSYIWLVKFILKM